MAAEARVTLDSSTTERLLAAWREHDTMRALHPHDRDAIRATEAARALVLELVVSNAEPQARREPRDLYTACARLGRLLADAGASPSLAALTIDGVAQALARASIDHDDTRFPAARASVVEGYFAAMREAERLAARRAWEYPACMVRLDGDAAAFVAGCPAEDGESLADWAARVAGHAARDGIKQAVLGGPDAARAELADALRLVGVDVEAASSRKTAKKWLRLPWRK